MNSKFQWAIDKNNVDLKINQLDWEGKLNIIKSIEKYKSTYGIDKYVSTVRDYKARIELLINNYRS